MLQCYKKRELRRAKFWKEEKKEEIMKIQSLIERERVKLPKFYPLGLLERERQRRNKKQQENYTIKILEKGRERQIDRLIERERERERCHSTRLNLLEFFSLWDIYQRERERGGGGGLGKSAAFI